MVTAVSVYVDCGVQLRNSKGEVFASLKKAKSVLDHEAETAKTRLNVAVDPANVKVFRNTLKLKQVSPKIFVYRHFVDKQDV